MIHLLHAGAVPFGYVRSKSDSCITSHEEDYITTDTSCHCLARGETFLLPDIVVSNTPPSTTRHQSCRCGGVDQLSTSQTQLRSSYPLLPNIPQSPAKATNEEKLKTGTTEVLDTCPLQSHLPHLSPVTRTRVGSHGQTHTPDGRQRREERQWQHIGGDLRKLADHFERNISKTWRKNQASCSLNLPVGVTQCVVASLICLAWWRLYNKFY